jgi:hypothetical protein
MTLQIKINPALFERSLGAAMGRGVEGGLKRVGLRIERESRRRAPVDTGSLKSSISSQARGRGMDMTVSVGPNVKSPEGAPYDVYQEFGTGMFAETEKGTPAARHRIKPRRKRALAFVSANRGEWRQVTSLRTRTTSKTQYHGNSIVVKSVEGTKPVHYMRDGLKATPIDDEFAKGFNAVRR